MTYPPTAEWERLGSADWPVYAPPFIIEIHRLSAVTQIQGPGEKIPIQTLGGVRFPGICCWLRLARELCRLIANEIEPFTMSELLIVRSFPLVNMRDFIRQGG